LTGYKTKLHVIKQLRKSIQAKTKHMVIESFKTEQHTKEQQYVKLRRNSCM